VIREVKTAALLLVALTVLTGGIYPLVIAGVAQVAFPRQANGSLIISEGQVLGSDLIGQPFNDPKYFWGRLSATGSYPYDAFDAAHLTASTGSNLGPSNPALQDAVQARIDALRVADPGDTAPIPVDLVTASASGLDPHISVAAAIYQVPRVARERGLPEEQVRELVARYTQGRQLGILGEPRVNVLELNLALDGRL
jgi:K+-transporting ATPase ATPase C chain